MDLDLDLVFHKLCDAKQLDHVTEFLRIADIIGCDLCDSFHVDIVKGHPGVERQRGHDRDLSSRVIALHICRRVRLRIAKLCGLRQRLLVIHSLFRHLCQDIVRGSVYDSHDLRQHTARKALL